MDRSYAEKNDIVRKYVANQLDPIEREAFEALLLEHPDFLGSVELDLLMSEGIENLANDANVFEQQRAGVPTLYRLAAAFGIVALVGSLLVNFSQHERLQKTADSGIGAFELASSDVTLMTIEKVRGSENSIGAKGIVEFRTQSATAIIRIPMSFPTEYQYQVDIVNRPGQTPVVSLPEVSATGSGDLVFLVPRTLLPEGSYTATVSGNTGVVSRFTFDVSVQP